MANFFNFSQHYVKILEASATIDRMLACAASIEELFASLPQLVEEEEDGSSEIRGEDASGCPPTTAVPLSLLPHDAEAAQYERMEELWNLIHDKHYLGATRILIQLRDTLPDTELARPTSLLLGFCRQTLGQLQGRQCDATEGVAEAIESIGLLEKKPAAAILAAHVGDMGASGSSCDPVTVLENLCTICDRLSLEKPAIIEPLLKKFSFSGEDELKTALTLAKTEAGYLRNIADRLFGAWLSQVPASPSLKQLFEFSCSLSQLCPEGLPKGWRDRVQSYLRVERPVGMELLLAPIFGTPSEEELQGRDPAVTETLFVPTGLPRVKKLGS